MRLLLQEERDAVKWDQYVHATLRILRTRKNRAVGMSPAQALYGVKLAKVGQWQIPNYRQANPRMEAQERRRTIRTRQLRFVEQTYPDRREPPSVTFQPGDLVLVRENNPEHPFSQVWAGPFPIAERHSQVVFEVDKNGRQFRYHVDQLRPAPPGNPIPDSDEENGSIDEEPENEPAERLEPEERPEEVANDDRPPPVLYPNVIVSRPPSPASTMASGPESADEEDPGEPLNHVFEYHVSETEDHLLDAAPPPGSPDSHASLIFDDSAYKAVRTV
ncbi:hypothetical protein NQ315_002782 [Exocentrus adspersus]|uniref:Uncharacterized protein n=1 Tax=Exocentrus adspersus TaxID=1586481 RepID=A0AAV8VK13_9CUCU|nr:hypothetical protein NQ315_002782 [Exocentrus adspersus]